MRDEITVTYEDEQGNEVEETLPSKWEICSTCRGNGSHSHGIGAITADEWARDWSCEEQEDYIAGRYDRSCERCQGSGKVRVVDEERAETQCPVALQAFYEQEESRAECDAIQRAEIAFGC